MTITMPTEKKHHWIISRGHDRAGIYYYYRKVDFVPSEHSSRIPADEIQGMSFARAVRTLELMYDKVTAYPKSYVVICRL